MLLSVVGLLLLAGFVMTLVSAMGKLPLWVPVLVGFIAGLLSYLPLK